MIVAPEWARFRSALQFLTVLPVPDSGWEADRMVRASGWFGAVGLLVGAASGAVWLLAGTVLPAAAAAGLGLAAGMLLTGGLHEDGLADTADGLGGGRAPAHRLEIMADSRIGAHGAAALVFSVGLRWAALAALAPWPGALALALAAASGRGLMVPATALAPYARETGVGRMTAGAGPREVALALAPAAVLAVAGGATGLLALIAAALVAAGLLALLARQLGGYTGDGLGAISQSAEIAVLLVLAAAWGGS